VATRLQIPHVELDALFWKPNWEPSESGEFQARVEAAIAGETWVVDGNYLRARPLVWAKATLIVWLNYPLPLILWRVTRRTIIRSWQRQELWQGCYETLQKGFFSQDSIILWTLKTYRRNQIMFPEWLAMPQYEHLSVVELRSSSETAIWLARLYCNQRIG
jgi:adenylate kinase family enzyme